jgi:hypothetical protein
MRPSALNAKKEKIQIVVLVQACTRTRHLSDGLRYNGRSEAVVFAELTKRQSLQGASNK